jgi:hypothetical protein
MNAEREHELESVIRSMAPLEEIVSLLRRYKEQGITQRDVYSFLESLHKASVDDEIDDRVLEVADFVAGYCAAHMRIWDNTNA